MLFEFENLRPDEPIANDEGLVDGHDGSALELGAGGADGFDEGVVFHAESFSRHHFSPTSSG